MPGIVPAFQFLHLEGKHYTTGSILLIIIVVNQPLPDLQTGFTTSLVRPLMAIEVPFGRRCDISPRKQPSGTGTTADVHISIRSEEQARCFYQIYTGRFVAVKEDVAENQFVYILVVLSTATGIVCSIRNSVNGFILDKLAIRIFIIGRNRELVDCYIRSGNIKDQSLSCQLVNMPELFRCCISTINIDSSIVRIVSGINGFLISRQNHAGFFVCPPQALRLCFPGVDHGVNISLNFMRLVIRDNADFVVSRIPDSPGIAFRSIQVNMNICILGKPEHIIDMGNRDRDCSSSCTADVHILSIIEMMHCKVRFGMDASVIFFRDNTIFNCRRLDLGCVAKCQHIRRSDQGLSFVCAGSKANGVASLALCGSPHFHAKDTGFNGIIVRVRLIRSCLDFFGICAVILPFDQFNFNIPAGIVGSITL